MGRNLKLSQINLHHCKEAASVLRCKLDSGQTGVCLIQEPYFFKRKVRGLGNAGPIHYVNSGSKPARACVFVRKDMNSLLLKQFSNSDFVAVQIRYKDNGEDKTIICCSAYLPYDKPAPTPELANIVKFCRQADIDLLIGCDANSHHRVWGSSDTNQRGSKLFEFICSEELQILNKGNRPTFINRIREEVIDITLCSINVEPVISNWHVSSEASMSDHQTIEFQLNADEIPPTPFRNPRKTNWTLYEENVVERLGHWNKSFNTSREIEEAVNELTESMILSYHEACPLKLPHKQKKPYWYSCEIEKLKREFTKAWNARRKSWENFVVCRRAYKKAFRRAKRQSWRDFCESVVGVSAVAKVHKILAKDRTDLACTLKLPNGNYANDENQILNYLLETHFPGCADAQPEEVDIPITVSEIPANVLEKSRMICRVDNIRWAIHSFSSYKSPGPDGIFPALLQKAGESLLTILSAIFNFCLLYGYIPKKWREVRITFIPKPGKDDYENPKNHRGISLSSFLLKTLEKLIDRFIREICLPLRPLHSSQHAYQKGRSTMSAVHRLTSTVERALDHKNHVLTVFLDIEGAFDRATFQSFKKAAQKHAIDPFLINWIMNMLQNRTLIADLKGHSVHKRPVMGCPQGGVLSPLIWLLIADQLLYNLEEANFKSIGFADDFAIFTQGKFIPVVFQRMQEALKIVENFTNSVSLSVNPNKVGAMLFTKSRLRQAKPLKLFGNEIKVVDKFKYLGLIIDHNLNWTTHIEERSNKACMILGQCRRAIGKKWGLSPKSVYWLYTMIVRPILAYGAIAWWHRAHKSNAISKLNHVQRLALLGVTGAMTTTPTAALESICGVEPLHIFVEGEARAELTRLKSWGHFKPLNGNLNCNGKDSLLWNSMRKHEPLMEAPSDVIVPVTITSKNFDVVFPTRNEWMEQTICLSGLTFFTDGSLCEGLAGAGVFSDNPEISFSFTLGSNITVFQAEVFAIIKCVQYCLQMKFYSSRISICSDSQAALKSLLTCKIDSALVLECKGLLNQLANANSVRLIWVPGHSNIYGNEEADELARNGSSKEPEGPVPILPLSKNRFKVAIKEWMHKAHRIYWRNLESCKQTKMLLKEPLGTSNAKRVLSLRKDTLRKLVGVTTGHYYFNKHLRNMGLVNSSLCDRCLADEDTAYHLICLCPSLAQRRHRILGDFVLSEDQMRRLSIWEIREFISKINLESQT